MHSLACDVSFDFSERLVTQYDPLNEPRPFRSSNSGPESRIPNRRDAFEGLSKNLRNIRLKRANAAATRSLLAKMDISSSDREDFRSRINDLTVQDQWLKRRLKRYDIDALAHLLETRLNEQERP